MSQWRNITNTHYTVSDNGIVKDGSNNIVKQYLTNYGYKQCLINGRFHTVHKLVCLAFHGNPNGLPCIDHIDMNKTNNNVANLRFCSYSTNAQNKKKQSERSSKLHGVYLHSTSKKWVASISLNKINYYLGCFADESGAGRAYDKKAIELYGNLARINFP